MPKARGTAEAAAAAKVNRFVHLSASAREPALSPYGASKGAGEAAVVKLRRSQCLVIRPPAVYGPGDKGTLPLMRALTQSRGASWPRDVAFFAYPCG